MSSCSRRHSSAQTFTLATTRTQTESMTHCAGAMAAIPSSVRTRSKWRSKTPDGAASLFVVFACYRLPMVPVLLLFAAAGVVQVVGLARQRKTRELLSYGALIAVAGVASRINLGNEENPRATAYYNLAVSLEHSGKGERAEADYQSAINAKPDFVQAHVNLGALMARRGDFEAAIVEERTAIDLKENDAIAHTNLANALFELGHLDEAELHYRRAVRRQPDLADAKSGLSALTA